MGELDVTADGSLKAQELQHKAFCSCSRSRAYVFFGAHFI